MNQINVVGLGYIGLPTSIVLAKAGLSVIGTDFNQKLVDKLNRRELTFSEPHLDEAFQDAINRGIQFSSKYHPAEFYIVAVPTPFIKETKKVDPTYVVNAVKNVLEVAPEEAIIIIESTVSPGFIDTHIRPLLEGKKLHVVHAPERIIPGNMIYELEHNARTIGADRPDVAERVKHIYASYCKGEIVLTDIRSAEMSKVVENTYRDVNIAFANELAKLCQKHEMDVHEIIRIANRHPRVNILQPGPGVGGHCISVDPWFLVGDFPEDTPLIHQARLVNDSMPAHVLSRIEQILTETGNDWSQVGLYGLTYKENVDDTRESPTLQLLERLEEKKLHPLVYDPYVKEAVVEHQVFDFHTFLKEVRVVVIMVSHQQIKENIDLLEGKAVLDTRNVFSDRDFYKI